MKKKTLLITGLATVLLASCSTVKVHSWMDPQFEGRKIGKTMVLGMAESDSMSRQYETLFMERLAELGIEASSLHASVQNTNPISEEDLVTALQVKGYNSIIVTRKLSETERQQAVTTGYYPDHYNHYYGYLVPFFIHVYTSLYPSNICFTNKFQV